SEEQTIIEEIAEETGFAVSKVERITSTRGALGFGGAKQTMFFAVINDAMKVGEGGGIDGENIELAYVPLERAREFMFDETKTKATGLMFAFMWFFAKFNR
ncbi:MAG: NUDIX hydrolase, partial [Campylobacter sp.]